MKKHDLRKLFLLIGFILMFQYFVKDLINLPAYLGEFFRGLGAGLIIVMSVSLLLSKEKAV